MPVDMRAMTRRGMHPRGYFPNALFWCGAGDMPIFMLKRINIRFRIYPYNSITKLIIKVVFVLTGILFEYPLQTLYSGIK